MHGFTEDVLVLVLVDVLALIVRFDGQLDLLDRALLRVQLLQILRKAKTTSSGGRAGGWVNTGAVHPWGVQEKGQP